MKREVREELLDVLPPGHPDAIASREDITRLNRLLGTPRWWARRLAKLVRPGDRLLEIGAGSGHLSAHLVKRLPHVQLDALDIMPRPDELPCEIGWNQSNALDFADYDQYDIIFGNFLLHQFKEHELRSLGARIQQHARVLAFCETARSRLHLAQFSLLRLAPLNPITRHDGKVSIRSGFRGDELSSMLGLSESEWTIRRARTVFGLYKLVATRAIARAGESQPDSAADGSAA